MVDGLFAKIYIRHYLLLLLAISCLFSAALRDIGLYAVISLHLSHIGPVGSSSKLFLAVTTVIHVATT